MGFLFKVLLFFAIIYLIINFLGRFLFGMRQKPHSGPYNRQSQQKEPESQEERILDYQKKSFESSDAVDVDFEEVKKEEP